MLVGNQLHINVQTKHPRGPTDVLHATTRRGMTSSSAWGAAACTGYHRPGLILAAGMSLRNPALPCGASFGPSFGTSISNYCRHALLAGTKCTTSCTPLDLPLGTRIIMRASCEGPEPSSTYPDSSTSCAIKGESDCHIVSRSGSQAVQTEDRPSSNLGPGVARSILSTESLEGGSMLPFLTVSEAYWKV